MPIILTMWLLVKQFLSCSQKCKPKRLSLERRYETIDGLLDDLRKVSAVFNANKRNLEFIDIVSLSNSCRR